MVDWSRVRREAIRQRADVSRRLTAAEDTLTETQAALKQAETEFDTATDRVAEAERALDAAYAERNQARRKRYAARQGHEQASALVARLRRRLAEISNRLDGMPV